MSAAVIEVDHVSMHYGPVRAVEDVSFEVKPGQVFGLTGHNGAGKSTLFKLMLGLLRPTRGAIRIRGESIERGSPRSVRRGIGYLPENLALYENLSGLETLQFFARIKSADAGESAALLDRVGLADAAGRKVREYSKGMRQRLGFAQALLRRPSLLLLDEPTNGLDPVATRTFYDTLRVLRDEGVSVVISSHLLSEIEPRVDALAIMANGRLLATGSVADLGQRARLPTCVRVNAREGRLLHAGNVIAEAGFTPVVPQGEQLSFDVPADRKLALLTILSSLGDAITGFDISEPTLEDVFLRLSRSGADA
ncbi:ABC transporter ATP-binding protein [Lysobacter sp.]|uniref:ABC transporter ATP-binding protein n=1 Tax=Lysobacter sp. TaxID=72226 RepID=UPI002D6BD179|nr:ABC transporter ATP-binding protein [Lysobacter sp.]HZX76141.1 ABC transporter ATP-binding protein [Lysobacter sp.]